MRTLVGGVVLVGMLALSGCVEGDPIPTLPPTPSTTPLFASEEEALDAAEAAYAAYSEAWVLITAEGGENPERIQDFATGAFLQSALDDFEIFRDEGWQTVGDVRVHRITLQFADLSGGGSKEVVVAYVCIDYSGLDVVNEHGESVVSEGRPDLQAFEVYFDSVDEGRLSPSDRQVWDVSDACGSV